MVLAIQYAMFFGLQTEAEYPYTAQDGKCQIPVELGVKVKGRVDVPWGDNAAVKRAVNIGPVSIAIEADKPVFQSYGGGVLNDASCGTQLDHGVLIVGYGNEGGQDFWVVKNSWGAGWGESGYIRIADVAGQGICGINTAAVYPTD